MKATTCPDCRVICGSLLLIVSDERTHETLEVLPCDGIDRALEEIAGRITHPEEDWSISIEVLSTTWNKHVENGGDRREFVFSRPRAPVGRHLVFTVFAVDQIGAAA